MFLEVKKYVILDIISLERHILQFSVGVSVLLGLVVQRAGRLVGHVLEGCRLGRVVLVRRVELGGAGHDAQLLIAQTRPQSHLLLLTPNLGRNVMYVLLVCLQIDIQVALRLFG